jgi:hypothetical protein
MELPVELTTSDERLRITDMRPDEITSLLRNAKLGHLGCSRDNHPYVVPMHYAFDGESIYFLTTGGTKTDCIASNSEVCFQVEEIEDSSHWQSVMAIGKATVITNADEVDSVLMLLKKRNQALIPAINATRIGAWTRLNNYVIYRLCPQAFYGRKTV